MNLCYQCRKCAGVCQVPYVMNHTPAQLIHGMRLGMEYLVLNSKTMWMCASSEMYATRSQQDVDVVKDMDAGKTQHYIRDSSLLYREVLGSA
jgi:heterodisulfide reductase subunit C